MKKKEPTSSGRSLFEFSSLPNMSVKSFNKKSNDKNSKRFVSENFGLGTKELLLVDCDLTLYDTKSKKVTTNNAPIT